MQGAASIESPLSVLVTGTSLFLRRHGHIFEALAQHFAQVDYLPERRVSHFRRAAYKVGSTLYRRAPRPVSSAIERLGAIHPWDARVFVARSLQMESQIASLPNAPDLILHVFGMYCPFWAIRRPWLTEIGETGRLSRLRRPCARGCFARSVRTTMPCTCSRLEMERGDP
jgi:hypothetical protein